MTNHKTLSVFLTIFLAGCAVSPYKMSENAIAIRNKMSQQEALSIVHKQMYPSEHQAGLCAVSPRAGVSITPGTTPSKLLSAKDNTITYMGVAARAADRSVSGNVMGGTGVLSTKYEFYDAPFTMNLTKIAYIGVEENTHFNEQGKKRPSSRFNDQGISRLSVQSCPTGQLILLYAGAFEMADYQGFENSQGGIPSVWVQVATENIDSFLAALSYLAPSATMRIGTDTFAW